jgi:pimeloyl-ACP methyl ester carboxylesterase
LQLKPDPLGGSRSSTVEGRMAKLEVNQATLEYAEHGSGEPLVFVHGSASDYRTWELQRDEFAKRYRVITYSRRYHWPNETIKEGIDYSMREQLDDLRALVRSLDGTPAHLVGHSYGAFLALLLATTEPSLVRTLMLAEPPVTTLFVSNTPKPLEVLRILATRPRTAAAIIKFGATGIAPAAAAAKRGDMEAVVRLSGSAILGREFFRRLSAARLEQVRRNSFQAEFLGSGFLPLGADTVRSVRAPTLLITGQHSPALFHRLTDALVEFLPNCEMIEIDGASHIMHEDNPSAYNDAALSFLARQPKVSIHQNP